MRNTDFDTKPAQLTSRRKAAHIAFEQAAALPAQLAACDATTAISRELDRMSGDLEASCFFDDMADWQAATVNGFSFS